MNTHRYKYESERSHANASASSNIRLCFDDKARGILPLDRSMPPQTASSPDVWDEYYKESFKDISTADVRMSSHFATDNPTYYTPYAVTFTYNAEILSGLLENEPRPIAKQWQWFQNDFNSWINLFRRRCKAVADGTHIACYEIYPELTKAGILHAHGLIYINNKYPSISHIMSKAWVDKTRKKGNSMLAMRKKNYRNSYDYAFAICNNVPSWRQYITKEQSDCLQNHCLAPADPIDIDWNC